MLVYYVLIALLVVLVVIFAYSHLQQKRLARKMQQLADEAESSKQQTLAEQHHIQQLKQEMTNNIAHELKTPVSSIRGYLEILLGDKPVSPEQQHYFLQRSYAQVLRLSNLISDVALINKMEEGHDLFSKEEVAVRQVVDDAVRDLESALENKHIDVEDRLDGNIHLYANKDLLYAIFRNLLENVAEHAGEDLRVVIESYKEDANYCYFHFYDNGRGVDNQYLSHIFDRFLRIDEGRSRQLGGSGLGLAIVKHSVLFHGGEIYAKNRDEGGLEFFFSLKRS
ncbi:MAG: HAMP domain-containing sensor histidine kinase [Bacteroidales bacterium]|nr:HAMP domain-containing sensor histidine kinase [Bacteroidales bacterium]